MRIHGFVVENWLKIYLQHLRVFCCITMYFLDRTLMVLVMTATAPHTTHLNSQ